MNMFGPPHPWTSNNRWETVQVLIEKNSQLSGPAQVKSCCWRSNCINILENLKYIRNHKLKNLAQKFKSINYFKHLLCVRHCLPVFANFYFYNPGVQWQPCRNANFWISSLSLVPYILCHSSHQKVDSVTPAESRLGGDLLWSMMFYKWCCIHF